MFGFAGIAHLALKGNLCAGGEVPLAHFDYWIEFHDSNKPDELGKVNNYFQIFSLIKIAAISSILR